MECLVRRGEIAASHLDHAEIHRRARGDVQRRRVQRDRERGPERLRARHLVPRAHARDTEHEERSRLEQGIVASRARARSVRSISSIASCGRTGSTVCARRTVASALSASSPLDSASRSDSFRERDRLVDVAETLHRLHEQGPRTHHVRRRAETFGDREQVTALRSISAHVVTEPESRLQPTLLHRQRARGLLDDAGHREDRVARTLHLGPPAGQLAHFAPARRARRTAPRPCSRARARASGSRPPRRGRGASARVPPRACTTRRPCSHCPRARRAPRCDPRRRAFVPRGDRRLARASGAGVPGSPT